MIWDNDIPRYTVLEIFPRLSIDFATLRDLATELRREGKIHGKQAPSNRFNHVAYHYSEEEIQTIWEVYRRNVMTEKYFKEENIAYHKRAYANHERRAQNYEAHIRPRAHLERSARDDLPERVNRYPRQLPKDQ